MICTHFTRAAFSAFHKFPHFPFSLSFREVIPYTLHHFDLATAVKDSKSKKLHLQLRDYVNDRDSSIDLGAVITPEADQ